MADAVTDPSRIEGYHAHLYYDPETRPTAARLRTAIGGRFQGRIGSWHDEPVGPHPVAMYQVAFAVEEFPAFVPWLMLNREGLTSCIRSRTTASPTTLGLRSGSAHRCRCTSKYCVGGHGQADAHRGRGLYQRRIGPQSTWTKSERG